MAKKGKKSKLGCKKFAPKSDIMKSSFDPNGCYTGVDYDDKYAKPIQDADDL